MKIYLTVTYYMGLLLLIISGASLFNGLKFLATGEVYFLEWDIISIMSVSIIMTLLFDWMSLLFMGFVLLISSMVMFYITSYMSGDKYFYRFTMLVYLFVLSMLFLIMSPNMISILLGWDGLGLVSYCLVIFYQNVKSANAGMLTILSNRIGDVAILLSISWLFNYGSWNFFYLQHLYGGWDLIVVMFLVLVAGMTKSAQMPFSAWLPAAMAAPTPVSALVHSSTLVTAGVYLLIRFSHLMGVSNFLFYVGVFTMFMSGLGANFEMDLKKIIALSTLSQLGLMMMTLSLGFYELSFFHLLTHALFKSLLFLCAGVFIHSMGDVQDIRHLGGVSLSCPVTSFYFIGSSLALCGFPFLAGFYSKDLILEVYFMSSMNSLMYIFIFFSIMFTLSYSVRLGFYMFYKNLGPKSYVSLAEEGGMTLPMSMLFLFSIVAGSFLSWYCFPCVAIFMPVGLSVSILLALACLSLLVFFIMAARQLEMIFSFNKTVYYLGSMWFLPALSTILFSPTMKLGGSLVKFLDHGWLEQLGGQGVILSMSKYSSFLDYFVTLNIKNYILSFFFVLVLAMIML
uniref:NADH-ubiquinone oxidoreductase chain 5 n=1 Tax=Kaylathalia klovstadi TaxID=2778773 RepID=A0A7T7BW12_9HEXA|nr:NADH dehydrogenase subunit 5 [Kaylathalia klovstadi]QQK54738.1 NADH dehydrogenase subunit 5 [Kaylathalia klovstadi]